MAIAPTYDSQGNLVTPEELRLRAEQSAGGYSNPTPAPGQPAPSTPAGGYDLEKFRKAWYGKGDVNNIQGWLDQNKAFTSGVTLKNEKAYDPSGRFIADLVGNYNQPGKQRTAIFLDGIDSSGKPRAAKGVGTPKESVAQQWNSAPAAPQRDPRLDELYARLVGRADQGLKVNREDPAVRGQADAYAANEERSKRNYLADLAEKEGPNANLLAEERLANERVGQRSGAFEAELMGREIAARRDEIQQALQQMQGQLNSEEERVLRQKLAELNDATQRLGIQTSAASSKYGVDVGAATSRRAQDLGWDSELLRNEQFMRNLGFNQGEADRAYDLRYRGL
jgi:hypothetical protein